MTLRQIDAVYYINLNHRKDRKLSIESQLEVLGVDKSKVQRISAIHNVLNGHLGCAKSHIKALDQAINNQLENVLILEDDMMFSKNRLEVENYIEEFFQIFEDQWDVFFLAANVLNYESTHSEKIKRVTQALCAHAYCVNRRYFSTLKECFQSSVDEMGEEELFMDSQYKAIDRKWMDLQKVDRWYIGKYPLGHQGRSYSDIEHMIRDRKHQISLD